MKKMLALIIVIIINVCVWNCSSMLISRAKVHILLISVGFKVHVSKIFAIFLVVLKIMSIIK